MKKRGNIFYNIDLVPGGSEHCLGERSRRGTPIRVATLGDKGEKRNDWSILFRLFGRAESSLVTFIDTIPLLWNVISKEIQIFIKIQIDPYIFKRKTLSITSS